MFQVRSHVTTFERLLREVRYAGRTLRKSPGFTAVAVLTLVMGIGVNTAIFSIVNAVLLRPLPVSRPDELIALTTIYPDMVEPVFSYAAYRQFAADAAPAAAAIAASSVRRDAITFEQAPEPFDYKWVSGNYFAVLGVPAATGRTILPSDDALPPREGVAVLSDAYWTRRFGRDASIIGRRFRFRGVPFTIVGIAPRGFFGDTGGEAPDVWMPMTTRPGASSDVWTGHSTTWLAILGRLRPGVTMPQARVTLERVYDRVREEVVRGTESSEFRRSVIDSRLGVLAASTGSSRLRRPLAMPLLVLQGIVAVVLLIACANVANLMLARGAGRRRAIAISLAMGASRTSLVAHGLIESLMIAVAGGAGGLLLAFWISTILVALVTGALPLSVDVGPDARVLAFTGAVSCATALMFGLAPALRAARVDVLPALKAGSSLGSMGGATGRVPLRRALVVAQMSLSLVLLIVAGLFVRSLLTLEDIETGFDPDRVLLVQITTPVDAQSLTPEVRRGLYAQLIARAESVPGVRSASASFSSLFTQGIWRNVITVEGFVPSDAITPRSYVNAITPRYFEVMGLTTLRGRGFTGEDASGAAPVAIVNQTFVRQFFGGADPIGRRVGLCSSEPCAAVSTGMREIVGLIEDAKYVNLREESRPMMYVPFTQHPQSLREIEVRTVGDPLDLAATVTRELNAVDARLAVVGVRSLRDQVDASLMAERLIARLSATFGLLALALATLGLYGVVAYLTAGRTGEIAIRMALGANRRDVRRLVFRDTVILVGVGVVLGIPIAVGLAHLLGDQLYGVEPADPLVVAVSLVTLVAGALAAGYLPARRASRVDPLVALRTE
jgi:predicted permease